MDRYKKFIEWSKVIIASCIGPLYLFSKSLLETYITKDSILFIITLFSIIAFYKISVLLVERSIEKSIRLRKFIFGSEFIEGIWVDVLLNNLTKEYLWAATLQVYFHKKQIHVKGLIFVDNAKIGEWKSVTSVYADFSLLYSYFGTLNLGQPKSESGLSEYNFIQSTPFPQKFTGTLTDPIYKCKLSIEGEKITDKFRFDTEYTLDAAVDSLKTFLKKYAEKGYSQIKFNDIIVQSYM